jgi:hypothetical protein
MYLYVSLLFSVLYEFLLKKILFIYFAEKYNLSNMVTIKSYSYSRLVLGYGPDRGATVTVDWNSSDKAFRLIFGKQRKLFCIVALRLVDEENRFDDCNACN